MTPEPGTVLSVCCHRCGQVTDQVRRYDRTWFCTPCYRLEYSEDVAEKVLMESRRHQLEKDFHERKMKELRATLLAIEAEGSPNAQPGSVLQVSPEGSR